MFSKNAVCDKTLVESTFVASKVTGLRTATYDYNMTPPRVFSCEFIPGDL